MIDFFSEEKKHWWHIAKRALVKQFIKGRGLDILVAGLGGGIICDELRSKGHKVTGIEISELSCKHVSDNFKINVISGNLENPLPFKNGSFDIVILADVLEHLDNDELLLREASVCLKRGGAVIVTAPAYPHMWSSWDVRVNHKRRYSLAVVKDKLTGAGLCVKKASYFNTLLYPCVYVYRIALRLSGRKFFERSDFLVCSGRFAGGIAALYYMIERRLLRVFDLPFGLSVFVIGGKDV